MHGVLLGGGGGAGWFKATYALIACKLVSEVLGCHSTLHDDGIWIVNQLCDFCPPIRAYECASYTVHCCARQDKDQVQYTHAFCWRQHISLLWRARFYVKILNQLIDFNWLTDGNQRKSYVSMQAVMSDCKIATMHASPFPQSVPHDHQVMITPYWPYGSETISRHQLHAGACVAVSPGRLPIPLSACLYPANNREMRITREAPNL